MKKYYIDQKAVVLHEEIPSQLCQIWFASGYDPMFPGGLHSPDVPQFLSPQTFETCKTSK